MTRKKTRKGNGILLIAIGDTAYYQMAYNMAMSIKFVSPDLRICLLVENPLKVIESSLYDHIIQIASDDIQCDGKFSPARIKCRMSNYTPFENTIYLDVDGCAINDLNLLMNACIETGQPYLTCVIDYGSKTKTEYDYNIWATNNDIWAHFDLGDTDIIPSLNSSFAFFNNSPEAKSFMATVQAFDKKRMPMDKLMWTWGKRTGPKDVYPDELSYMAACAKMQLDPKFTPMPILFSQKPVTDFTAVKKNYFLVAIYGDRNTTHRSLWDFYDRTMSRIHILQGKKHIYTKNYLAANKHANTR